MVDVIEDQAADTTTEAPDVDAETGTPDAEVADAAVAPEDAVVIDARLLRELSARAREQGQGLRLTGKDGLLTQLAKVVIESALEGEMDAHLGYAKHDPAGRDGGNSRNGYRAKTVLTDAGPVELDVPRDRAAAGNSSRDGLSPIVMTRRADFR